LPAVAEGLRPRLEFHNEATRKRSPEWNHSEPFVFSSLCD
jgi:hypothetical protein